ncbi:MAG: hypothetical protein C5B50_11870 [Verrucomicrobia bacterium]|nr:MAG: hypothetical protein C5B50_11870 [Verrucomicrobiota bacterium]
MLRLLAANRNPDSFTGGGTVLHQSSDSPRASKDVDYFHDTVESLGASVQRDVASLREAGYEVELAHAQDTFQRAVVTRAGRQTKIEWVFDSAFRFFPVEQDLDLGWRLNFWDAATNKVLAFAGRSKIRDLLDIVYLHEKHLHLGALAWAASGKDPGMTPEAIIQWGRRNAIYRPEELEDLQLSIPITLPELKDRWLEASDSALQLIAKLPVAEVGCFYLNTSGQPVSPSPEAPEFAKLTRHFGSVKGAWPRVAGS